MTATDKTTARGGPLAGVRVIDLTRLAPGPYCTMLLSDLGADVIVVGGGRAGLPIPTLSRGKRFATLDLKSEAGQHALHRMIENADVVIEGFRPGVAARVGADYVTLSKLNPRLIYCSLTGYGQDGPRSQEAGHDINYLAISGVLGATGPADRPPYPPLNLLADFGGGGLLAAFGIVAALHERNSSGKGQQIDAAMIDGCISMMAMHFTDWRSDILPERGHGLISGNAPYYRCYACADGRHISVGALERGFFEALWSVVGAGDAPDHMDVANWPAIEQRLTAVFASKTRDEWAARFAGMDACVAPVLTPDEVWSDVQVSARHPECGNDAVPAVPRFDRTVLRPGKLDLADKTAEILGELGFDKQQIAAARGPEAANPITGLSWPPQIKNASDMTSAKGTDFPADRRQQ
jgi:alpha-methylacyl-CoA racemase